MPAKKDNTASQFRYSVGARRRHKEHSESDPSTAVFERRKPGNRGNFHGARARFIDEHWDEFLDTRNAPRKVQRQFWTSFFHKWWQTFHWSLPLDTDPDPDAPPPPPEDENTDQETLEKKARVLKDTQKVGTTIILASDICSSPAANHQSHALPRQHGCA